MHSGIGEGANKQDEYFFCAGLTCFICVFVMASIERESVSRLQDVMTYDLFMKWKVPELKNYLKSHAINQSGFKPALAAKAFDVWRLGLGTATTVEEDENAIRKTQKDKLKLEGGLIQLPDPKKLLIGWTNGFQSVPEVQDIHVKEYMIEGGGNKGLKTGTSLVESGHIEEIRFHNISPNLKYCFIMARCTPQEKHTDEPYTVWVCVHKESGKIITAECECPAGMSEVCKHVGGLLWSIEAAVRKRENKTCTDIEQTWSKPSKKSIKLHKPDELGKISVKKVKPDMSLMENQKSAPLYDPRVSTDRYPLKLSSADIDQLSEITGHNCAPAIYKRKHNDVCQIESFKTKISCKEVEVVSTELPKSVEMLVDEVQCSNSLGIQEMGSQFMKLLMEVKETVLIPDLTIGQSSNKLWFAYRYGRVTASKMHRVMAQVNNDLKLKPKNEKRFLSPAENLVSDVLGYKKLFFSKATSWGTENESKAVKRYFKDTKGKHQDLKITETGVHICKDHPFIAASPDGVIYCSCCPSCLLEVKSPWKHRNNLISDLVADPTSCLHEIDGKVTLKRSHAYWTQVQCQMGVLDTHTCVFYVFTLKDSYCETISFDKNFWALLCKKASLFYKKMVVPEMFSHEIKDKIVVKKTLEELLDNI